MFDLMIKGASLTDDDGKFDIACKDGRIVEISKSISGESNEIIHADGCLLSPPFVDPHFHMDATLSLGTPRLNVSGTLLEGISLWGELKPLQSIDDIVARAMNTVILQLLKVWEPSVAM